MKSNSYIVTATSPEGDKNIKMTDAAGKAKTKQALLRLSTRKELANWTDFTTIRVDENEPLR